MHSPPEPTLTATPALTSTPAPVGGRARNTGHLLRAFAALLVVALFGAACGSSDADADAEGSGDDLTEATVTTAGSTDEAAEDSAASTAQLDFAPCGGAECATLEVPLDYDDPDGETTPIHVTRSAAKGDRIGSLFVNPGGPGGAVGNMIVGMGRFGPPPIIEAFDLIGVDPRGTGESRPISCNDNLDEDLSRNIAVSDGLDDDVDAFTTDFAASAAICAANFDAGYLASITTENAARDLESVRLAIGGEPMNYLGYSYGTAIGALYATYYPDSVRSMVLDGGVPMGASALAVEERAGTVDEALRRLDLSCDLWIGCPIGEIGLLDAVDQVRSRVDLEGSVGPLRAHSLESAIGGIVTQPWVMPDVAEGLRRALNGSGDMLHGIGVSFTSETVDGDIQDFDAVAEAIICADGWGIAATAAADLLDQAEQTSLNDATRPTWGVPCDLWPVQGQGMPSVEYSGDAPILVVGNTDDPITPLSWSEALVEDLGPNAELLTWNASAHTVVFQASMCIDDHTIGYLLELVMPEPDTVCQLRGLIGLGFSQQPVVVDRVTPGSPSDDAGVLVGDQIVEMDGRQVESAADVLDGFVGAEVELTVERDGELVELSMVRGVPVWELWRTADDLG